MMLSNALTQARKAGRRGAPAVSRPRGSRAGAVTLTELMLGFFLLVIGITALLGALVNHAALNEHSRNLSWALNDANRVLEQVREQNHLAGCATPTAIPPGVFTSWDAWLAANGGKNINPGPERIIVTCLRANPNQPNVVGANFCGNDGAGAGADQIGTGEWQMGPPAQNPAPPVAAFNPIRVSVSVCWRHRNRTIGAECGWAAGALTAADTNSNGIIDSPAVVSTVVTCHSP